MRRPDESGELRSIPGERRAPVYPRTKCLPSVQVGRSHKHVPLMSGKRNSGRDLLISEDDMIKPVSVDE